MTTVGSTPIGSRFVLLQLSGSANVCRLRSVTSDFTAAYADLAVKCRPRCSRHECPFVPTENGHFLSTKCPLNVHLKVDIPWYRVPMWTLDGSLGGRCWKFGWILARKLGWIVFMASQKEKLQPGFHTSFQASFHLEGCQKKVTGSLPRALSGRTYHFFVSVLRSATLVKLGAWKP